MYLEVELGGKKRGLKFSMLAIMFYEEKAKGIVDVSDNAAGILAAYAIVFAGLKANAFLKELPIDFTYEDVVDWVDAEAMKGNTKFITEVVGSFTKIQTGGVDETADGKDESKKKVRLKT